jgi:hypothetical protein
MTTPVKVNFKIYQGSTFEEILRWASGTKAYRNISSISRSAPCVINCLNHGMPKDWRFKVTNVAGMKEINSDSIYYIANEITSDAITINSLNSLNYSSYTSGGIVEYMVPVSLTGYTARMQLRQKVSSEEVILELNTSNGGIELDPVASTIKLHISADQTQELNFSSCVYSLEMVKSGRVTQLISGSMSLEKEVTR